MYRLRRYKIRSLLGDKLSNLSPVAGHHQAGLCHQVQSITFHKDLKRNKAACFSQPDNLLIKRKKKKRLLIDGTPGFRPSNFVNFQNSSLFFSH